MRALKKDDYGRVWQLAQEIPLANAAAAVVDGNSPGQVWVDNVVAPAAALVDTPEGCYLLGSPRNEHVAHKVADLIISALSPGGHAEDWWWFSLRCGSDEWATAMARVLPASRTLTTPREFYLCEEATVDPRAGMPAGFELLRVDRALLECGDLKNVERIRRAARSNFGSIEAFLEVGFAFCVRHGDEIVSACTCDCVSGRRCEVGIHTAEGFRRRGLATAAVAAAVEWTLSNGYKSVGWHCHPFNVASAATALRAGFRKVTDYTAFKICARPADADVLKATAALIQHRFQESADLYGRALRAAAAADASGSYLLGDRQERTKYLMLAAGAFSLAGQPEAATALLDGALDLGGYRQGGY